MEYLCESCWNYPCASDKTKKITGCFAYRQKPTNSDKLRAMSDEELAEYFLTHASLCPDLKENKTVCKGANFMANDKMCRQCWLGWLKQEGE